MALEEITLISLSFAYPHPDSFPLSTYIFIGYCIYSIYIG